MCSLAEGKLGDWTKAVHATKSEMKNVRRTQMQRREGRKVPRQKQKREKAGDREDRKNVSPLM